MQSGVESLDARALGWDSFGYGRHDRSLFIPLGAARYRQRSLTVFAWAVSSHRESSVCFTVNLILCLLNELERCSHLSR